jgi:transitional endoplasmic reticulum ATPase
MKLVVKPMPQDKAGRGLAILNPDAMQKLGVEKGDYLLLSKDRGRAVARAFPGPEESGSDIIWVDGQLRSEAGVGIDDRVEVEKADVNPAKSITVALPANLRIRGNIGKFIHNKLIRRAVTRGQQVPFSFGFGAFSSRGGQQIPMQIAETDPSGTVVVTDSTEVNVSEQPAEQIVGGETGTQPTEGGTPNVTYEDIGGLDDELEQVREMIELPMRHPELFQQLGIEPPKGVLLHGPPGTGKTLIAKAVANEVDAAFRVINGPEVVSKYKGDSEERLRSVFEDAAENQPAVVFIDELDAIAGERDEEADMENRLVAQLLTLLDGLEERGQVVVVGATNRVDAVDPALRRGGRFDREIEIGAPGEAGRREILDVHTRDIPLAEGVDLDRLAARTHGFVGADVRTLTQEAAMAALRDRENRDELTVTRADVETALSSVEPSAMREYVAEAPAVDFSDVGGLDEAKATLREAVEWPALYAPLFEAAETEPASGVLLHGPPGTGKTLLARAVAGETEVNFIHVAGPELLDRYVGESEKAVREVFDRARQAAPAIVFLDEIDGVAGVRGTGTDSEVTERVVSQLLAELDNAASNPRLVVLAATNRRDDLDPALLRPGRLETHVEVPEPDETARRDILKVHTAGKPLGDDVDLDELAARTDGYSGADIASLVREASMHAIRAVAEGRDPETANAHADELALTAEGFEQALGRLDDGP